MYYLSSVTRKPAFCICATKTQISFAVTTKLISAFVFANRIVQSLYFQNPKFQASSHLLWLDGPLCVRPGQKLRRQVFSQCSSTLTCIRPLTFSPVCFRSLDVFVLGSCGSHGELTWFSERKIKEQIFYKPNKN